MNTTTSDGGGADAPQPETSEAVTTDHNSDQVITTDDNGTPTMAPVTSQSTDEAAPEPEAETSEPEAQAPAETEDDLESWAKKKGLPMDDPKKLAKMYRDAEKKIGEATAKARELETAAVAQAPVDYTGDPQKDALTQTVNTLLIQNNVRDFFSNHPEAKEFESKMAEIVTQRPHLQNDLDALYALARTDPTRESDLRAEGGKQALTNLAQKQSAIPPGANATNSGVYTSGQITPSNVYDLIESNDQEWFQKNYTAINKAISGK